NGSDAQLWKFIENGDGSFYIRSKLGTVIDVSGGVIQAGRNVHMYTMNGSSAQKWKLNSDRGAVNTLNIESGTYTIQNSTNTKQLLDVNSALVENGANVQTYASNNTSAQRFEVLYVGDGYYQILAEHSGKADRKSTRLNFSHVSISYAVFCLKKKKRKGEIQADVRR